jgi:hypothetical protein
MADDDAILAGLELRAPDAMQFWWFHLTDIALIAVLLAGGADPVHKLMNGFRKFMEASSARFSGRMR